METSDRSVGGVKDNPLKGHDESRREERKFGSKERNNVGLGGRHMAEA